MPRKNITIEQNVKAKAKLLLICAECGGDLRIDQHFVVYQGKDINALEVIPCKKCKEKI